MSERFPKLAEAGHFRQPQHVRHLESLWLSSIGIGTYLGEPDSATDQRYTAAAVEAIRKGVNVLDTAINYRLQRSERSLGAAIQQAISTGDTKRDELLVCSKAGYLTFDATVPGNPQQYFRSEYIDSGLIPSGELVGGMHCLAPGYLRDQLRRSRHNLGLETIDVYYLHNPEQQLSELSRDAFERRMLMAFGTLEEAVSAGHIRVYGTATWNGYRQERGARDFLDLESLVKLARQAGGQDHHFRAIQLPFNLGLTEAFTRENQRFEDREVSSLRAANEYGIAVIASASLMQGRLAGKLPEFVRRRMHTEEDADAAVQFTRSAPGITTALIGMSRVEHVQSNLKVASQASAAREDWRGLFDDAQAKA